MAIGYLNYIENFLANLQNLNILAKLIKKLKLKCFYLGLVCPV